MIRVPIIAGLECQGHSHPPNPVPGGLLGKKKTERKQKESIISTIADGRDNSITAGLIKNTLPDIKSGVWVGIPRFKKSSERMSKSFKNSGNFKIFNLDEHRNKYVDLNCPFLTVSGFNDG